MDIDVPNSVLEIHFLRHGKTEQAQDSSADGDCTHTKIARDSIPLILATATGKFDCLLHSRARCSREIADTARESGRLSDHGKISELDVLYYPVSSISEQLRAIDRRLSDQGMTLGRILADEQGHKVYRYHGGEMARAILEQVETVIASRPDLQRPGQTARVLVCGHDLFINAAVWALVEGRVNLDQENLVLSTRLDFFDRLVVKITPTNRGQSVELSVHHRSLGKSQK